MSSEEINQKERILCVCQGGNCRSVALAFLLKYRYHVDALAVGWEGNTLETLTMLCDWANHIIVLESYMKEKIPVGFHSKVSIYDVGPDQWFQINQDLLSILDAFISRHLKPREVL